MYKCISYALVKMIKYYTYNAHYYLLYIGTGNIQYLLLSLFWWLFQHRTIFLWYIHVYLFTALKFLFKGKLGTYSPLFRYWKIIFCIIRRIRSKVVTYVINTSFSPWNHFILYRRKGQTLIRYVLLKCTQATNTVWFGTW